MFTHHKNRHTCRIWSEDWSHYFDRRSGRLAANGNTMQALGLKRPNDWRLYDMLGNVREWVSDWYGETYYQSGSERDPQGPDYGTLRVLRGGSWDSVPGYIRVSDRYSGYPDSRYIDGGCRCLREGVRLDGKVEKSQRPVSFRSSSTTSSGKGSATPRRLRINSGVTDGTIMWPSSST